MFFDVGYESYLPAVVPASQLFEANGRVAASQSVAEVSAFAIAGWLVQIFTAPVAILIDAITFLASAGFIASIRSPEARDWNNSTLSWRCSRIDRGGRWGWDRIEVAEFAEIVTKLRDFETMTWKGISAGYKPRGKEIPTEHTCDEAQTRLQDIGQEDIDSLWSLRLEGAHRLWGIRDAGTYHVIWWDPDHEVCPSEKD